MQGYGGDKILWVVLTPFVLEFVDFDSFMDLIVSKAASM